MSREQVSITDNPRAMAIVYSLLPTQQIPSMGQPYTPVTKEYLTQNEIVERHNTKWTAHQRVEEFARTSLKPVIPSKDPKDKSSDLKLKTVNDLLRNYNQYFELSGKKHTFQKIIRGKKQNKEMSVVTYGLSEKGLQAWFTYSGSIAMEHREKIHLKMIEDFCKPFAKGKPLTLDRDQIIQFKTLFDLHMLGLRQLPFTITLQIKPEYKRNLKQLYTKTPIDMSPTKGVKYQ